MGRKTGSILRPSVFPKFSCFPAKYLVFGLFWLFGDPKTRKTGPKRPENADFCDFSTIFRKIRIFNPLLRPVYRPKGRDASPRRPGCWLSRFGSCSWPRRGRPWKNSPGPTGADYNKSGTARMAHCAVLRPAPPHAGNRGSCPPCPLLSLRQIIATLTPNCRVYIFKARKALSLFGINRP